jgi:hypothetical protein
MQTKINLGNMFYLNKASLLSIKRGKHWHHSCGNMFFLNEIFSSTQMRIPLDPKFNQIFVHLGRFSTQIGMLSFLGL